MTASSNVPLGRLIPRHSRTSVEEAISDTRIVLVNGARQSGKSTLVTQIGKSLGATRRTLDRSSARQAAEFDPAAFIDTDELLVIDEIQRVPELLLAIKERVDNDPRPGQYLLTGSSRVLALRSVPDALPGRIETIELWPFSQGEIEEKPDRFIDAAFEHGPDIQHASAESRSGYIERIVRGGFPEAVSRSARRREVFFDNYVADIINRDVLQISEIEKATEMRALVGLLAARSGQLGVLAGIANELRLPQSTISRYVRLLEDVFLVKRIPAWSRNISSRAISTAKIALVDSGIAANLIGQNSARLARHDSALGGLLEAFVAMEIARQLSWSDTRAELFHYRTKDKVEVDIVLEDRSGHVIAIDVKASSTARAEDFRGLTHLHDRLGDDLIAGYVLYTGQETLPFGPRFRAVPISALWELG